MLAVLAIILDLIFYINVKLIIDYFIQTNIMEINTNHRGKTKMIVKRKEDFSDNVEFEKIYKEKDYKLNLIKSPNNFIDIFGITESQLQNNWIEYIKRNYLLT